MSALSHIGLTVQDLERSVQFYCDILGCKVRERGANSAPELAQLTGVPNAAIVAADLVTPDGTTLELIQYLNSAEVPLTQRPSQPGHTHISFSVRDVEAIRTQLVKRYKLVCTPLTTLREPGSSWDGIRVFYALDPDARTIEFLQPPRSGQ